MQAQMSTFIAFMAFIAGISSSSAFFIDFMLFMAFIAFIAFIAFMAFMGAILRAEIGKSPKARGDFQGGLNSEMQRQKDDSKFDQLFFAAKCSRKILQLVLSPASLLRDLYLQC